VTARIYAAGALALALAVGGCSRDRDDGIRAQGTIEVVEVDLAPMVPARVVRVWVPEGATVRSGDTLVSLTQATLGADIAGQRARVGAAEATLRDLERGARPAEIQRGEAELRASEADAERTARDLERLTTLAATGAVSQQQLDAARSAARTAASRRDAARESLRLLREGTRPERIQAARAELATARANLQRAQAAASDLLLVAPVDGTVLARHAEPGEVLGAGEPALTVGEVRRPWIRVYVSALDLPKIRVGSPAAAALDAFPGREFAGRVVAINDKAEFTPRIALTEEERADLVFGVKVALDDTTGVLKPGLPATVRIRAGAPVAATRAR
jgi:HlyD family secretion protein